MKAANAREACGRHGSRFAFAQKTQFRNATPFAQGGDSAKRKYVTPKMRIVLINL